MPQGDMDISVALVGTKVYTADVLDDFQYANIEIDHLVCLTPEQADKHSVAGYHNLAADPITEDLAIYHPDTYGLDTERDRYKLSEMDIDLLLVAGWSRLVPEKVLNVCSIGALGAHGSPEGLPKGRGRAVLNWALIEGEREFNASVFFLEPGIDSGDIIDTRRFEITPNDTASTLRYKLWMVYSNVLIDNFEAILADQVESRPQDDAEPTYYPKRIPKDGAIDWNRSAEAIDAFVRALTAPYPGAFTSLDGRRINVWSAQPYDRHLDLGGSDPGTVTKKFQDGEFLVQTNDVPLLITDYDGAEPGKGDVLESADREVKLKEIRTRYPPFVDPHQQEI